MAETVRVDELFEGQAILLGKIGPTIEVEDLTETEVAALEKFIGETLTVLDKVNPYVADIMSASKDLIFDFAKIFKAKVKGTIGGEAPSPGQIGVAMLAPYDLKYVDTPDAEHPAYTAYRKYSWIVNTTEGTPVYLLGDATNYFKMSPVVGKRALGVIFQNGLIEIGTTPSFNQIKVATEQVDYAPFRIHTLNDIPIDPRKPIYIYRTPYAIPLWYDYGIKMSLMPAKTGQSDIRLFGVVFYEYGYHADLI